MRTIPVPKIAFIALITASLSLSGCDRPVSPEQHRAGEAPTSSRTAAMERVRGKIPAHVATRTAGAVIGRDGGTLELAGHRLVVPAGAVAHPTRFRIRLEEDGYVQVDLTASSISNNGRDNDVGSRGFAEPVRLYLSYAAADAGYDPDEFVVVWVSPAGELQPFHSTHDPGDQTVAAELDHFSPYALATN